MHLNGMRSGGGVEGMATSVVVNQAYAPNAQRRRINPLEFVQQDALLQQAQQAQQ